MHEEPKAEITKEAAQWRVSSRKSLSERRFYVDFIENARWGRLGLVADNLTHDEAESMVLEHNTLTRANGAPQHKGALK